MTEFFDNLAEVIVGPDRFFIKELDMSASLLLDGSPSLILSITGWQADTGEERTMNFMTSVEDWTNFFNLAAEHMRKYNDPSA